MNASEVSGVSTPSTGGSVCATRYPVLLVHGIMDYDRSRRGEQSQLWGRVPGALRAQGATVFFGGQDAVGSCEHNAEQLYCRIQELRADTGADKVNIIAHSKGGIDVRYLLHRYGEAAGVASLTTMSSPHGGMHVVDFLSRMPCVFKAVGAALLDVVYRACGDEQPDSRAALRGLTTDAMTAFNACAQIPTELYCQSYGAFLPRLSADPMMLFTFALTRHFDGDGDGVVSLVSAQWRNFRGVIRSDGRRGISHIDLIDRRRRDFDDVDVVQPYVGIVADLASRGL